MIDTDALAESPFTVHRWQEGVQFDTDTADPEAAKDAVSDLCDALANSELPREFRITDANHYEVEAFPIAGGLAVNHFRVSERGEGIGRHLVEELERMAKAHDFDTITLWIGANGNGETEAFLDAMSFDYGEPTHDEAHGRTYEAEKSL